MLIELNICRIFDTLNWSSIVFRMICMNLIRLFVPKCRCCCAIWKINSQVYTYISQKTKFFRACISEQLRIPTDVLLTDFLPQRMIAGEKWGEMIISEKTEESFCLISFFVKFSPEPGRNFKKILNNFEVSTSDVLMINSLVRGWS